jgi:hypothetical protein
MRASYWGSNNMFRVFAQAQERNVPLVR